LLARAVALTPFGTFFTTGASVVGLVVATLDLDLGVILPVTNCAIVGGSDFAASLVDDIDRFGADRPLLNFLL